MDTAAAQRFGVIIQRVIDRLLADELLVLKDGGDATALVGDILGHMDRASDFAQAGKVISGGLLASPQVDDLFASDGEIIEIMNHLDG